ncbi:MAG: hypothetical protein U0353_09035 [Sandaracinus sp.]
MRAHDRLSSSEAVSAARAAWLVLVLLAVMPIGGAHAQGRELAEPFLAAERAVDPTALPPAPEPGLVPVVIESEERRALHVIERRRGEDRPVCVAPCARWLAPGALRLGMGDELAPRFWSEPLRLTEATTIELHYVDNALTRAIGFVVLAASLVTMGGAAFDFLDQGPTDPPVATTLVAIVALGVSFGLFFVGDGVDVRVHPGIEGTAR